MEEKIAVFGGTFNPVHSGHINIAKNAAKAMGLKKVIFLPTGNMWHKDVKKTASGFHRYNMVKEAICGVDNFEVSDYEIRRSEISYTVDTMAYFKDIYSGKKVYFLCGADVLFQVETWKQPERLFKTCEFIVAARSQKKETEKQAKYLKDKYGAIIHLLLGDLFLISSTQIREDIKNNRDVSEYLPKGTLKYIENNSLYKQD